MLKIKIHRGSHQIGGCATEIEFDGERILIDLGSNLPGTDSKADITDKELLDSVFGIDRSCKYNAVLFSHYHGDHIGLYKEIPEKIPMYVGKTAKEILKIVATYIDLNAKKKGYPIIDSMKYYRPGKAIGGLRKIKVTPFAVDHSALDAYMFLIEAGGKRILFTGDFRDHGIANNKGQLWRVVEEKIGKVDILITEGTMLSRVDEARENIIHTEDELGLVAESYFLEKKYNFVCVSSTNLDSIMEFYHNTPNNMMFVCDAYQAKVIMAAVENRCSWYKEYQGKREYKGATKPIFIVGDVNPRVFKMLNKKAADVKMRNYPPVFFKKLEENDSRLNDGFVMLVRPNRFFADNGPSKFEKLVERYKEEQPADTQMIYSMWNGYLEGDTADEDILRLVGDKSSLIHLHTSGHAYVETIAKLIGKVEPSVIIPMHTEMADSFKEFDEFIVYRDKVRVLTDGEDMYE